MDLFFLDFVGVNLILEVDVVLIKSLDSEILAVNNLFVVLNFSLEVLHRESMNLFLVFDSLVL